MGFTEKEQQRILKALKEKSPKAGQCIFCGKEKWEIGYNFVTLAIQEDIKKIKLAGQSLVLLPVTCSNCGNTHLINLVSLGLRDMFEGESKEEKKKGKRGKKGNG